MTWLVCANQEGVYMTYIWFNPVIIAMYGWNQLETFAKNNQFQSVQCKEDWGSYVKDRYKEHLTVATKTILDMRCPKAVDYIKEHFPAEEYTFPDIEPILIHCAREVHKNMTGDDRLLITTPCQELAEYGNKLDLKNTTFISFNQLLEEKHAKLSPSDLSASPIPPGFFHGSSNDCITLTGEEEIQLFFSHPQNTNLRLIELLYCPQGCHNGGGVK